MNKEELKKIFAELMPKEIQGYKRPDEGLSNNHEFNLDLPQLIAKDPVRFDTMNMLFSVFLSNDNKLKQKTDDITSQLASLDLREATENIKGLMSAKDKQKLNNIEENANRYVHPKSGVRQGTYKSLTVNDEGHIIKGENPTTLAGYGITDAVKKGDGNLLPPIERANNARFLRNDNTWQTITPSNIGAYGKSETYNKNEVNNLVNRNKLQGYQIFTELMTYSNSPQGFNAVGSWMKRYTQTQNNGIIAGDFSNPNGWWFKLGPLQHIRWQDPPTYKEDPDCDPGHPENEVEGECPMIEIPGEWHEGDYPLIVQGGYKPVSRHRGDTIKTLPISIKKPILALSSGGNHGCGESYIHFENNNTIIVDDNNNSYWVVAGF